VKLPGLPIELWNKAALKALGDGLGKFIDLKTDFQSKMDTKVIKILMELDLQDSLPEELEIVWGKWKFTQPLDY
jgi:hypothetical protein